MNVEVLTFREAKWALTSLVAARSIYMCVQFAQQTVRQMHPVILRAPIMN